MKPNGFNWDEFALQPSWLWLLQVAAFTYFVLLPILCIVGAEKVMKYRAKRKP